MLQDNTTCSASLKTQEVAQGCDLASLTPEAAEPPLATSIPVILQTSCCTIEHTLLQQSLYRFPNSHGKKASAKFSFCLPTLSSPSSSCHRKGQCSQWRVQDRVGLGTAQTWVSAQNANSRRETHLRLRYRIPSWRCLLPYPSWSMVSRKCKLGTIFIPEVREMFSF